MIKGLGKNKHPFLYLDDFIDQNINFSKLHAEISLGLAKSKWVKRFVSVGVHPSWEDKEIATYIRLQNISDYQKELYKQINEFNTEEKLKYFMCITPALHPFWSCYLRINNSKEKTRMINKSIAEDCEWTDDAKNFSSLISLIESMPFESIGRIMLFLTEPNNQTVPHFDSTLDNPNRKNDDFIWFKTHEDFKQIFVYDPDENKKIYPDANKKFLWFNEMDYHGTDASNRFSFSIRIDGKFKNKIKKYLLNK